MDSPQMDKLSRSASSEPARSSKRTTIASWSPLSMPTSFYELQREGWPIWKRRSASPLRSCRRRSRARTPHMAAWWWKLTITPWPLALWQPVRRLDHLKAVYEQMERAFLSEGKFPLVERIVVAGPGRLKSQVLAVCMYVFMCENIRRVFACLCMYARARVRIYMNQGHDNYLQNILEKITRYIWF